MGIYDERLYDAKIRLKQLEDLLLQKGRLQGEATRSSTPRPTSPMPSTAAPT